MPAPDLYGVHTMPHKQSHPPHAHLRLCVFAVQGLLFKTTTTDMPLSNSIGKRFRQSWKKGEVIFVVHKLATYICSTLGHTDISRAGLGPCASQLFLVPDVLSYVPVPPPTFLPVSLSTMLEYI